MTPAEIEADKVAKMKELLQRGDATIPKRTTSFKSNSRSPAAGGAMTAVNVQASGFTDYAQSSNNMSIKAAPAIRENHKEANASSVPAPVQSRVVFQGATGLGLGTI